MLNLEDPLRITAVFGGDDAIQWASWHGAEPDLELFLIGCVDCGAGPAGLVPAGIIRHAESRVGLDGD